MCIRDRGANDPRVNKAESDQMVEALKKRGIDVEYMVKNDEGHGFANENNQICLLYTSDAADERSSVDLGGRRIIKKKNKTQHSSNRQNAETQH